MGVFIMLLSFMLLSISTGYMKMASEDVKSQQHAGLNVTMLLDQENALELVRAEFFGTMRLNAVNDVELVNALRCQLAGTTGCPSYAALLVNEHSPSVTSQVLVKTVAVSDATELIRWADVEMRNDPVLPINFKRTARIRLGQSTVFKNAVTADSMTCVFCHVTVYGNVGEYQPHYLNAGDYARIYGKWLSAGANLGGGLVTETSCPTTSSCSDNSSTFSKEGLPILPTDDDTSSAIQDFYSMDYRWKGGAGGTTWSSSLWPSNMPIFARSWNFNYNGPELAWNVQRQQQIQSKFDPDSMMFLAKGSITGGRIFTVPYGADGATVNPTLLTGALDSINRLNVILDGRDVAGNPNPLTISGRVYFAGDVIILGKVQGVGEIYSGRNIYIPDDLQYVNPPPHFDGTVASNTKMADVSTNASALATEMAGYDQLALFAANNLIIGDPYADDLTNGVATSDLRYILAREMTAYNGALAIEKATGYMLEPTIISGGQVCWSRPWARRGDCIPESDPNFSNLVLKTPTYNYLDSQINDLTMTDALWHMDRESFKVPSGWATNFYPNNQSSGNPLAWITASNFFGYTQNLTKQNNAKAQVDPTATPTDNRRRRYKSFVIPIPGAKPYDPLTWNVNEFRNQIETYTGLFSEMANEPLVQNLADPVPVSAEQHFREMFDTCKRSAIGTGTGGPSNAGNPGVVPANSQILAGLPTGYIYDVNAPWTNFAGSTRFTYDKTNGGPGGFVRPEMDIGGKAQSYKGVTPNVPEVLGEVDCRFYYDRSVNETGIASQIGRVLSEITLIGMIPDLTDPTTLFLTGPWASTCDDDGKANGLANNSASWHGYQDDKQPICTKYHALVGGVPVPSGDSDPEDWSKSANPTLSNRGWLVRDRRYQGDDDLLISIKAREGVMLINTRYWNPSIARPRNRIRKVQASLFANQFMAVLSDSEADRAIEVDGGMVARNLLGKFVNTMGSDRTYSATSGAFRMPTTSFAFQNEFGNSALVLVQDPRFQFGVSLIYDDFGSVYYQK